MLSQLHREVKSEKLCRLSFDCYVLRILFVSTNVLFCFFGPKISRTFYFKLTEQSSRKKLAEGGFEPKSPDFALKIGKNTLKNKTGKL